MIKRLRGQFVLVTMVLMAVLLSIILGIICYTTWRGMKKEVHVALDASMMDPQRPGAPHLVVPEQHHPCFILRIGPNGQLEAKGHAYYDLSDQQQLLQLLQEAQATGKESGILQNRNLYFQRKVIRGTEEYVFADISEQLRTMQNLFYICILIFLCTMTAFFGISWWLSKWMIRPVERAWNQQRQFVADASHELKTPLTVILTNAEMLQSQEYDTAANHRLTDGIVTMAGQMRDLTEGMLELAKTDANPAIHALSGSVNLSDLAENCVMRFEPVYFEAGRTLESQVQPGIHVRGCSQQLQQLVDILLDNGRKYSTPDTSVILALEHTRSHCTLQVSSHGVTLTPQQCRDIFQRFYRVDEARSRSRSYGLGLAIAEAIVHRHRGKIWAQGKDGVNTFSVMIPTCSPDKSTS